MRSVRLSPNRSLFDPIPGAPEEILRLMRRAKKTEADIASEIKVSVSSIYKWSHGKVPVHPVWLDAIRKACGTPCPKCKGSGVIE